VDDTDPSFVDTALRETQEELGIDPKRIEILGEIGPAEINLRGDMSVSPFVGFVHHQDLELDPQIGPDDPLPSLDLSILRKKVSQPEVDIVFHVSLSALTAPARLRSSMFRGQRPYWAVNVTDFVHETKGTGILLPLPTSRTSSEQPTEDDDELGSGKDSRIEVWGLTGWYLTLLMRTLQVAAYR